MLTGHEWLLSLCKAVYGAKRWIVFKWVRSTKRAEFVDGKTAVVPRCKVRFLTYPFQRTAISGNSFSPINSCMNGIHPVSSTGHAIGCMLRHHSFSLRQPLSALPGSGI